MTKKTANGIAAFLARLGRAADGAGLPDAALLERYLACRDEAAFAALVRRHGPMVFGVCRRVLSNEADAEDAFQATFLVLATKAASIRPRGMVGNWLYGVARNIALKAKAMTRKRRTKERDAGARTAPVTKGPDSGGIMEFLDVELAALPDHYRLPILLHDLEGRTIREVASHLGWPQGTVATRLARGRAILARRLARYGLGLSGGALAAVLADRVALASVPPALAASTLEAVAALAAGHAAAAAVVRTKVMVLAKEALKDMLLTKLKTTVSLVLAAALLSGAGLFVSQAIAGRLAGGADPSAPPKAGAAPPGQGRQPAPSWHERATLTGHDGQVNAVAFSPDGKTLASGGQDCAVVLWDLVTGKARTTLRGHQEPVACVAFSPDGKLVASGSAGVLPGAAREKRGQVKLWDAASGKERATLTLGKAGGPVSALAFSADGKFLAAAGETAPLPSGTRTVNGIVQPLAPGAVGVWETATGKVRATLRDEDVPWFQALAFSPDGKRLAAVTGLLSPGQGNSVKLWDWPLQKELLVLHPPQQTGRPADNGEPAIFAAVLFCPDGKTLATVDSSAGVQFWDGETGEAKKRIRLEQREGWGLAAVTRSPDGSTWATASGHHEVKDKFHVSSGQVALWDAATGELRQRLPEGNYVASLAFSPNGKLLAAGSRGSARVPAEPRAEDLAAGKLPEAVGDKRGTVKIWEWRP